jgi:hypothetical protein
MEGFERLLEENQAKGNYEFSNFNLLCGPSMRAPGCVGMQMNVLFL